MLLRAFVVECDLLLIYIHTHIYIYILIYYIWINILPFSTLKIICTRMEHVYTIIFQNSVISYERTVLKAGRSQVRFPTLSLKIFVDIILLAALWPGVDSASNRNEYQEYFLWGKGGRCVGLTTLLPSCADCLEIWAPQLPGTPRACPDLHRDCFNFTFIFLYFWNESDSNQ
jgi:hypothetical protein